MDYTLKEDGFDLLCDRFKILFIPIKGNNYSPKFLASKWLLSFVIILIVVKIVFVSVSLNFPKFIFFADVSKTDLVQMINQERKAIGLNQLSENVKLNQAAQLKALDMIKNQYFAHISPTGITPWFWFKKTGYNYTYAGENLAIGFTESYDVYNAWFDSDSHRENFLNKNYNEVGTAVLETNFQGNSTIVVVQLFGKPKIINSIQSVSSQKPAPIITNPSTESTKKTDQEKPKGLVLALEQSDAEYENDFLLKSLNVVFYNYEALIQKIILITFVVVAIISLTNIIVNYKIQNINLVRKSLLMVVLLFVGLGIDKNLFIEIFSNIII